VAFIIHIGKRLSTTSVQFILTTMINPIVELERRLNGGNQYELAKEMGVTPSYLSMVLKGTKPPAQKVLKFLGLVRVKSVTYKRVRRK
jgi:predicted transcriptional regulator